MKVIIYSDFYSKTSTHYLPESIVKVFGSDVHIERKNRLDIQNPDVFNDCDLFILPGILGDDCKYYNHIAAASSNIKQFIEKGGVFLGLCAGAYYAMTNIEYLRRDGVIKHRISPLGLIEGTAKGPVKGDKVPYFGNWHWDECVARELKLEGHLTIEGLEGRALYSCGPQFIGDKNSLFKTFARYADHPEQPSALIMRYYGEGLVIASGVCAQYDGSSMQFNDTARLPAQKISLELARYKREQQRLWNFILGSAIKHRQELATHKHPMLVKSS